MKLTAEQKKERAAARKAQHDEEFAKYPPARLMTKKSNNGWVQVLLEGGSAGFLNIRLLGNVLQKETGFDDVLITYVGIDDPSDLARFIAALVARYNILVSEMNDYAAASSLVRADTIKPNKGT